jgi:hypothetical protein
VLSLLAAPLYADIFVDDNAPGDPLPFDRQISDPHEDGSAAHPFDSIQEAIDAAVDGDTIIVAPGHYLSPDPLVYDEINFKGKNIRLVSSAPTDFSVANKTILCGVVIFQGDEDPNCLLQGFKVQSIGHGGILGNGTQATVANCIISGNGPCSATVVKDVHGRIANCLIVNNTTIYYCGVMPVISGCTDIVNCTIANNASGVGVATDTSIAPTIIRNCIIYGNQGTQVALPHVPSRTSPLIWMVTYSLIQGWTDLEEGGSYEYAAGNFDGDPCFVQPGYWLPGVFGILVEGDYHLKSKGFRWTEEKIHGSHWYYDLETSCAIDAGDPMDSLGEEPDRGPDDPEGRWAVNHAIDCGAYGGTTQASLAPNKDRPPGIAAVDLRDYLPLAQGNSWGLTADGQAFRDLTVTTRTQVNGYDVSILRDTSPLWWRTASCVYIDYTLYTIQNAVSLNWLPDTFFMQAKYPQYLTVGSTIQAPDDPFAEVTTPGKPALVMRGTLGEMLAGTTYDPNQFAVPDEGLSDVIAIREKTGDGTAGGLMAIFGRGFGPVLLGGLPVTDARIGNIRYVVGHAESTTGGSGTTKRR